MIDPFHARAPPIPFPGRTSLQFSVRRLILVREGHKGTQRRGKGLNSWASGLSDVITHVRCATICLATNSGLFLDNISTQTRLILTCHMVNPKQRAAGVLLMHESNPLEPVSRHGLVGIVPKKS
jgi:hypothetical protein